MKMKLKNIRVDKKGFTLVEMAVVLVIISLVIYASLAMGRSQIAIAEIRQTKEKLAKIQNAVTIYYKTYGYLPCPADPTLAKSNASFGVESRSGTQSALPNVLSGTSTSGDTDCGGGTKTSSYLGAVPTRSLNLPDEFAFDAWDNRISFVVSGTCVDVNNWSSDYKYKCYDGADTTANGGTLTINGAGAAWPDKAAFLVISHGKNGLGAWNNGGTRLTGTTSAAERANGNLDGAGAAQGAGNVNVSYYDKVIYDGDIAANYFDDLVVWSTAPMIYYEAKH